MFNRLRPRLFPLVVPIGCALVAVLLAGCVGYRLGSMLPADIQTVHVATFFNETDEPLIELDTTRAALRTLRRDGSLRIAAEGEADAILVVTLTDFRLEALGYDRERRVAADEYRMRITASYVLTRADTGEVVAEDPRVIGESEFVLLGDMTSAKQGALPDAAEDLAQRMISSMVEMWR